MRVARVCVLDLATQLHSIRVSAALALAPASAAASPSRRGKTVFAVLPQHTCVNHVNACSRMHVYASKYCFENRVFSLFFSPICLKCVAPLVKLDRRAQVCAHVRARVISDVWYIVVKCRPTERDRKRVDYECRYFSEWELYGVCGCDFIGG